MKASVPEAVPLLKPFHEMSEAEKEDACAKNPEYGRLVCRCEEITEAEIIDAYSVKPLDAEAICASARKTGCVVTAEEHSSVGGLGSAVAEALAEGFPAPLERVAVPDVFGKSGEYPQLSEYFGLDAPAIVEAVNRAIARK